MLYYIFKKASKGLTPEERSKWLNWRLRPLVIVSILFNIGIVIDLEKDLFDFNEHTHPTKASVRALSCVSPIWFSSCAFEFATVLVFLCFVLKLDKQTKKQISFLK